VRLIGMLPACSLQVQYMPLAEGQAFDGELFKLFADLVRDIKMGVSVVSAQDLHCSLPGCMTTAVTLSAIDS
jgi:hypothetical protein